jgi:hypothetical protein
MKKRIHINQHVIRANKKNGTTDPAITVKTSKRNIYADRVEIGGASTVVYSPDKPLSCGARVWIETDAPVSCQCGDGVVMLSGVYS